MTEYEYDTCEDDFHPHTYLHSHPDESFQDFHGYVNGTVLGRNDQKNHSKYQVNLGFRGHDMDHDGLFSKQSDNGITSQSNRLISNRDYHTITNNVDVDCNVSMSNITKSVFSCQEDGNYSNDNKYDTYGCTIGSEARFDVDRVFAPTNQEHFSNR